MMQSHTSYILLTSNPPKTVWSLFWWGRDDLYTFFFLKAKLAELFQITRFHYYKVLKYEQITQYLLAGHL